MDHHIPVVKRGLWSIEEDQKLVEYIKTNGHKNWSDVPTGAGLGRCGKSCRLRWMNYLRPDVKLGNFTEYETSVIIVLQNKLGNKWAKIAKYLPGRTDNEIKNYWNTTIKKRLLRNEEDQHFGNILTSSLTSAFPAIATPVGSDSIGGGSTITGSSLDNNIGFSYSKFSQFNNSVSFSPISKSPPPPPPSSDNSHLSNQNIFQGFGPFPSSTSNNYQINFNNTYVSIPEVVMSTPTSSIIENHPQIQPTWTSTNNNYSINFHEASNNNNHYSLNFAQSFNNEIVPFMSSDITTTIHDENFHAYPPINNNDSSVMMHTPKEDNIVMTNNNNRANSSMVISDYEMGVLEIMMSSSCPPVPSPSTSTSSFLEEQSQALINNSAIWSFNNQILENPDNYMFDESIYALV